MSDSTCSLETIEAWLTDAYNAALSTYRYEDHVRLTNGSAGHYVDISMATEQTLTLEGERYGECISDSCAATRDALLETLSTTL